VAMGEGVRLATKGVREERDCEPSRRGWPLLLLLWLLLLLLLPCPPPLLPLVGVACGCETSCPGGAFSFESLWPMASEL